MRDKSDAAVRKFALMRIFLSMACAVSADLQMCFSSNSLFELVDCSNMTNLNQTACAGELKTSITSKQLAIYQMS